MHMGQLLPLQEDIGAFVAGPDTIGLELGVLRGEEFIFLGEDLGAE